MNSDLAQMFGYEYINDADMANAMAAEKRWREKVERRQEQAFRRIMAKMITKAGLLRLFTWI